MKDDKPPQHHQRKIITRFSQPLIYLLVISLSYTLGYLSSSSSSSTTHNITTTAATTSIQQPPSSSSSKTTTNTAKSTSSSIPTDSLDHFRFLTRCGKPVSGELIRQTLLYKVYNGTSPYNEFPPPHINSLIKEKRIKGAVFENLIRKVKPTTIIEVGTFLGASAIHMVELTRSIGLKTQILCVDDFRGWAGFRDERFKDIQMVNGDLMLMYQFMQNVVYSNVTELILPIPFSTQSTLDKFCEWGILGDLVEVDAGHDFHSAWSDINRAYKILRPGGVMFGHDYLTAADERGVRRAVNLFARVNGFRVLVDGQHWVIDSS
ncbi:hypothetical protein C5167_050879 [Papaver somniferum]|uniref:Uncharacterized protein n=1 Tax=Papaver somniferum TaxID=3469 RepID=A0A4Y7KRE3_PAPSO|nr:uncharacterized protein LOC113303758 [Papaver somniferum]RZC75397.1 hypothetical protein C5167_050879 [Papaver somniferum]